MGTIEHKLDVKIAKEKARWLPTGIKYITQIFISIRALFTLPFFKETPNGVQRFFVNNYSGKRDEFIFDGTNENSYYDQIIKINPIDLLQNKVIVDLGCGSGSFYFWLKNQKIKIERYYGIDFAYKDTILSQDAMIKNSSIDDYFNDSTTTDAIYLMSNSLCYLSDETFKYILSNLKNNDQIIIIEPYPNLFWDSHFNGVKPYYRSHDEVFKILMNTNFTTISCSIDYVFKIKNNYINPISYCLHAKKVVGFEFDLKINHTEKR